MLVFVMESVIDDERAADTIRNFVRRVSSTLRRVSFVNSIAVSYTHLDVYKRQLIHI